MEKMNWHEAKEYLIKFNNKYNYTTKGMMDHICTMVAVISEDSFTKEYSLESRSYVFTNDNKAFLNNCGYSIFASSLDGSDPCVRLERYLEDEGVKDGWKLDYCYIKSED